MIKIRSSLFETNSSSADRYDDYDWDEGPTHTTARQTVRIEFSIKDGTSNDRCSEIDDEITDKNYDFEDMLTQADELDDYDDWDFVESKDGIVKLTADVTAKLHMTYSGCKATRYSPAEDPEYEFEYVDIVNISPAAMSKLKEQLLKLVEDIPEITECTISRDDIDEDEFYDNIKY